ncbi:MAG: glycosyltransferase family 2 protein [bacterium]|nr:glycosyltransferase family 2 protein [bacterium]
MSGISVVIPTLGNPRLLECLAALEECGPAPQATIVVHSGTVPLPSLGAGVEVLSRSPRLGFAEAVNLGIEHRIEHTWATAVLNDDAQPSADWLRTLSATLEKQTCVAAVQGTITQSDTGLIDGRGIELDPLGLPVQVDRDLLAETEPTAPRNLLAVSATAALYRNKALRQIRMPNGDLFDSHFGSYHEDLDVGLRLRRLGWKACWIPNATCRHTGSASGPKLRWRHPWWVLANRWRALAGNLAAGSFTSALPILLRGEIRAIRTLTRQNWRAVPTGFAIAMLLPWIAAKAELRRTPGTRLRDLPRGER